MSEPRAETATAEIDLQARLAELEAERDELLCRRDAARAAVSEDKNAYAAMLERQRDEAIEARRALAERRAAEAKSRRAPARRQELEILFEDVTKDRLAVGAAIVAGIAFAALLLLGR